MADGNPAAAEQAPEGSTRTAIPGQAASGRGDPAAAAASGASAPGQEASVGFVTATYTNYVNDLQRAAEGLRQRALAFQQDAPAQLQELQSKIQPQTQELVQTLQETESPIAVQTSLVVEVFGWSSILLLSFAISSVIGSYVLSPILGIFIGRAGSALIASLILPLSAAYYLHEADGSTSETRAQLLAISSLQGVLHGHALAYVFAARPISFVTPLVIAFAYPLVAGQVGTAHVPLVAGSVGASLVAQLAIGTISGSLSLSYLLLSLLYSVAAGAVLQLANKYLQAPTKIHLYQILLTASIISAKALVFGLLGSDQPPK